MGKRTWNYGGDVDALSYGGKWIRKVGARRFHIVELTNMDEACGSDNDGHPRYVVELSETDLDTLSEKDIQNALKSCGWGGTLDDLAVVEMAHSYGFRAPLHSVSTGNGWAGVRECKAESRSLESDPEAYEERLDRPVNAIGSTAREFGRGDLDSGLMRTIASGSTEGTILGKMHGFDESAQKAIKEAVDQGAWSKEET